MVSVGLSSKRKSKKKPRAKKQCRNKINEVDDVSEEYTKEINVMDYLSEDIWFEIFTHLPLKRIFQLKLLSKQWYSLISSSNFCTRKLNLCTFFYKIRFVRLPRIRYQFIPMLFSSNTDSSDYFMSDQAYIRYGFSFNFLLENMQEGLCILGSSNGLLLCRYPLPLWGGDPPYYYFICNPLTRDWIPIPGSIYDDDEHESRVLVCESSSSTWNTSPSGFKVVRIPEITVPTKKFYLKIFSSNTGCWKNHKVLCKDKITMLYENTKKVVSDQNERLYWIVETNKILVYDLKNNVGCSGECMLIGMPKNEEKDHGSVSATLSCLAESEGFIFYIRVENKKMDVGVWLLEEKDDSGEQWYWKEVYRITLNKMLEGYEWNNTRIKNMKPLGVSPMDRNIMFLQSGEYILQYNILTRRSQLLSLSSHLCVPISYYEFGVLPFLMATKPTRIPVIRKA